MQYARYKSQNGKSYLESNTSTFKARIIELTKCNGGTHCKKVFEVKIYNQGNKALIHESTSFNLEDAQTVVNLLIASR